MQNAVMVTKKPKPVQPHQLIISRNFHGACQPQWVYESGSEIIVVILYGRI